MDAKRESGCRQLARGIDHQLASGIALSTNTLHFMASTFAIEGPQELTALLADPDDSESQSLLKLLFSPDESTQAELESKIENNACTGRDVKTIVALLLRKAIEVPIRFPNGGATVTFVPPEHLLETYVLDLRITRRLHSDLSAAIDKYVSDNVASIIKVKLRNTRVKLTRPVRTFLCRLFKKTDCTGKNFLPDLEISLSIFSEQAEATSLFDLLMTKKRSLLQALRLSKKFEKQLAENNIETLILKGVRTPHIDMAEAKEKIIRIDAICLAVFGITDPLLQVPTAVDLGSFNNPADLKKAFKILS